MSNPSGVSRRIQQCIERLHDRDWEGALVNLFPAIDKTAKRRRPNDGVGKRMRALLQDEEVLITAIGMRNVFKGCQFNDMSLHDALYKFGRTPIAHEGELDSRLCFVEDGRRQLGGDKWILPVGYIVGMTLAVVIAPENSGERTSDSLAIAVFGKQFMLSEIWGHPEQVREHICATFRNPNLFSP
jgi:hypothetical protein